MKYQHMLASQGTDRQRAGEARVPVHALTVFLTEFEADQALDAIRDIEGPCPQVLATLMSALQEIAKGDKAGGRS